MIQIDLFTVLLALVSFLVFYQVLFAVLAMPVLEIDEERTRGLGADRSEIDRLTAEVQARRADIAARQQHVRDEVRTEREILRSQTANQTKRDLEDVMQRADGRMEKALDALRQDVELARPRLREEATALAAQIEKVILT